MRFLFRLAPKSQDRREVLDTVRGIGRSLGSDLRNPKWTSRGALEMDSFSPSAQDFQLLLSALAPIGKVEFYRDLNVAPPFKPEEDVFREAVGYFNSERYWECHEALEGVWRQKTGAEKSLLQGLILVCAAYVHSQKGEPEVASNVLKRARRQLEYPRVSYHSINLLKLRDEVDGILATGRFRQFDV